MTNNPRDLDAHEQPSEQMRAEWKGFSKEDQARLLSDPRIDDPRESPEKSGFVTASVLPQPQIASAFMHLGPEFAMEAKQDIPILYHPLLPGLLILPSLIPSTVQTCLMGRLIHRDLSNPKHQTNLHLHYDLPYSSGSTQDESSFFSLSAESEPSFVPKDPSVHKPLSIKQVMSRRLHWVTLGGQYDWTNRIYPQDSPPPFPKDLSAFLGDLFPETVAQAAILNFYTPGDTMMMHRDVSEETDKGLISLSFGCDCLFMITPNNFGGDASTPDESTTQEKQYLLLRLRSGDAIYMTGESRFAWHGVPKVLKGTCPEYLADWPAQDDKFSGWKGWMANKRINLNVRQMRD